jgi:hypothetical protein
MGVRLLAVLLRGPDRHGFQAFERRDHQVRVVRRAESGEDRAAHRADLHRLLRASILDVRLGNVMGVQGVERRADLVLDVPGDLVPAGEPS